MAPCDRQLGTWMYRALGILGTRWNLVIGDLAHCDGQLGMHWHFTMGNLVRIGTLTGNLVRIGTITWATWQADTPRASNMAQYSTLQWTTWRWHYETGNLADNGTIEQALLAHYCTTRWAT